MTDFFKRLFESDFMPHGHCFYWKPDILYLHLVSDGAIAIAYSAIPLALVYFVYRCRDAIYPWLFLLFAGFIFACAATHVMSMFTLWVPVYRAEGVLKAVTAAVSLATAGALWALVPKAMAIPSPARLREANEALRLETHRRANVEAELREALGLLEARVEARTADLAEANRALTREVAERKRAEEAARRLAAIVESSDDAILFSDLGGAVTNWNRGAERLFGYSAEEIVGKPLRLLVPEDRMEEFERMHREVRAGKHLEPLETVRLTAEGRRLDVAITVSGVANERDIIVGESTIARDISARKRAEAALTRLATVDSLTGVFNRRRFLERLHQLVSETRRYGGALTLCMMDLDRFKEVNDRHGHPAGDAVLARFGKQLAEGLREVDVAGRYGGDEFGAALPRTDAAGAALSMERLRRAVAETRLALEGGAEVSLTASFGVAELRAGMTAEDLVQAADAALYAAKSAGGDRVIVAEAA